MEFPEYRSYPNIFTQICNNSGCTILDRLYFIALIHPIQWTIAYPVGADRPAKRQKKTSCVSTGQAGPVLCTRQMVCRTSFLSRQRDIASFSFGACTWCTDFLSEFYFQVLSTELLYISFLYLFFGF